MIIIRAAQLAAMRATRQTAFVDEMCVHLTGFAPEVCEPLGAAALRAAVELGVGRAHGYGLDYRGPVRLYLELCFILGSGFADDPQVPWAGATLRDEHGDQDAADEGREEQRHRRRLWRPGGPRINPAADLPVTVAWYTIIARRGGR